MIPTITVEDWGKLQDFRDTRDALVLLAGLMVNTQGTPGYKTLFAAWEYVKERFDPLVWFIAETADRFIAAHGAAAQDRILQECLERFGDRSNCLFSIWLTDKLAEIRSKQAP